MHQELGSIFIEKCLLFLLMNWFSHVTRVYGNLMSGSQGVDGGVKIVTCFVLGLFVLVGFSDGMESILEGRLHISRTKSRRLTIGLETFLGVVHVGLRG